MNRLLRPSPVRSPARFVSVALLFAAGSAWSQNAPSNDSEIITLSPFVVSSANENEYTSPQTLSATRVSTDLIDLPVSISIISSEFMKDLGLSDIQEALRYQNVSTNTDVSFSSDVSTGYVVRGFDARVLRNGFPAAGGFRPVSRIAVDRIELVKGPASLLYGAMDPGGVVNVVSKRPGAKQRTVVEASGAEYDNYRGSIDTTGPLTRDGRVRFRLMGAQEQGDGIAKAFHRERTEWVGMLQFNFTPATELNVEFNYTDNYVDAPPSGPSNTTLVTNANNGNRGAIIRLDLTWPWEINTRGPGNYSEGYENLINAELRHRFNARWNARVAYTWRDGTAERITRAGGNNTIGRRGLTDTFATGGTANQAVQADLVAKDNWRGIDWTVVGGLSYDESDDDSLTFNSTVVTFFDPNDPATWALPAPARSTFTVARANGATHSENTAAYVTNQLGFFKGRIHTLLGARHQQATASSVDNLLGTNQSFKVSKDSYQAGLLAKPLRRVAVYASWSQSFVPQNQILKSAKPIDPATGLPVVGSVNGTSAAIPVEGNGIDVGIKSQWLDGNLEASAAWFNIERSNIVRLKQIRDNAGNVLDDYQVQGGIERSIGLELGLNGRFFNKSVTVLANYTHCIESKLLTDTQNPANIGKELAGTPEHRVDFFTRYMFQHGRLKGLFLGGGGTYTTEFQGSSPVAAQVSTVPGYSMFTAVAGYNWRVKNVSYGVQLNVNNLENERVVLNSWSWSTPRSFRLTLRAAF